MSRAAGAGTPQRGRGRYEKIKTAPPAETGNFRKVEVLANFVPLTQMPDKPIYKYRVDFAPNVEDRRRRGSLFNQAFTELFTHKPIYDSGHECRSPQKLPNNTTSKVVQYQQANQECTVTFTYTGTCTSGLDCTYVYNIHMNEFLKKLNYYDITRGLYVHPQHADEVSGQDMMMLRGFRTSANIHEGNKMLMNLEAGHKIVQKKNVLQFMEQRAQQVLRDGRGNLDQIIKSELVGKLVVAAHNSICYRIEDVDKSLKALSLAKTAQASRLLNIFKLNTTGRSVRNNRACSGLCKTNGAPNKKIRYYYCPRRCVTLPVFWSNRELIKGQKEPSLKRRKSLRTCVSVI
jgi:hypothetical protein